MEYLRIITRGKEGETTYLSEFQNSIQNSAIEIFNDLDNNLDPNVFLLGIHLSENESQNTYFFVPKTVEYRSEIFSGVFSDASHFQSLKEAACIGCPSAGRQIPGYSFLTEDFLRESMQKRIENIQPRYKSFTSWPVEMEENELVFIVIQLKLDVIEAHYCLINNKLNAKLIAFKSLIHSTITEYLIECEEALRYRRIFPNILFRDNKEIIRSAGKLFMRTSCCVSKSLIEKPYKLTCRVSFRGEEENLGTNVLFDAFNSISSMKYEGTESVGKIILSILEHSSIKTMLTFSSPININNYRAVRKLLEMSEGDICLLYNDQTIYGLGKVIGPYDQRLENIFIVKFIKHQNWVLTHAGNVLMSVVYGQPALPKPPIEKNDFHIVINNLFKDVETKKTDKLWEIIEYAIKQKHGTMVVISKDAESESRRLDSQSTAVQPFLLTPDIAELVTAIDGAILINIESICFAIGVILDGLATNKGDPSRGARYNSAVRYVEATKAPCLAVVVSEDGSIDLIYRNNHR